MTEAVADIIAISVLVGIAIGIAVGGFLRSHKDERRRP